MSEQFGKRIKPGVVPVRERRFIARSALILIWCFITGFALFFGGAMAGGVAAVVVIILAVAADRTFRSYYSGADTIKIGRMV